MSGPRKEYVIDPVKPKPRIDLNLPPMRGANEGAIEADAASEETTRNVPRAQGLRMPERRSGLPLLLMCCAGPLAIFATSRGRRSRIWPLSAVLSVLLGGFTALLWDPVVGQTAAGSRGAVTLLVAACAATVAGFAAWSRGIFLIGRQEGARIRRIPELLKRPGGTGLLGALVPGLGLLISGRARQAAASLWIVCAALVSAMILSQADWIWRFDRRAGALAAGGRALEYFFVFLAVCALAGALAWIAQALAGMRHSPKGDGRTAAARAGAAIAVSLAAIAAWSLLFERGPMAERLDRAASVLHEEGLEFVPVGMAEAAMRLDSSHPEYTARAIEIYERAGRYDEATALRRSLVERLAPCIGLLEEEGLVVRASTLSRTAPAGSAGEAVPAGRLLPAELLIAPQTPFVP